MTEYLLQHRDEDIKRQFAIKARASCKNIIFEQFL